MRDILKKATTGAMIAGAALLVAACGGETEANNAATTDLGNEPMLDTNLDTGLDDNMMDANMMDGNMMDNTVDGNMMDNTVDANTAE